MDKIRFATVWLTGCSGCHMSFLDLDEWLFELAKAAEIVYSPISSDIKEYPAGVDLVLVEGGVGNQDNLNLIKKVRQNSKVLVSFGDCAISANVPGMRNMLGGCKSVLERSYLELTDNNAQIPSQSDILPVLLDQVLPIHQVVEVDFFLPGCPPSSEHIKNTLMALLEGKTPSIVDPEILRFG